METEPVSASCLCSAVRWETQGPFEFMSHCHCSRCRKAHGSAYATYVMAKEEHFRITRGRDGIVRYESSPGMTRPFCGTCGSPMYAYLAASRDVIRVRLGSLDTPFEGRPRAHTWVSDKAAWELIEDSVPQFPEWAPRSVL